MQNRSHYNQGYNYILVMIDLFSKYMFAIPIKTKSASQGIVERFNKTLKQRLLLIMTQNSNKKWLLSLESVLLGYNNSKHSSTAFAPEYLCFNSSADEIKTAHQRLKARAAKSINPNLCRQSQWVILYALVTPHLQHSLVKIFLSEKALVSIGAKNSGPLLTSVLQNKSILLNYIA